MLINSFLFSNISKANTNKNALQEKTQTSPLSALERDTVSFSGNRRSAVKQIISNFDPEQTRSAKKGQEITAMGNGHHTREDYTNESDKGWTSIESENNGKKVTVFKNDKNKRTITTRPLKRGK